MGADSTAETERLRHIARTGGLVLLYHGIWPEEPAFLRGGLHNVTPTDFARQMETLAPYFKLVAVDEFAAAKDKRGLAAVSFDDGYNCIFDFGLDAFRAYDVPVTVYVNGATLEGEIFWRDKIRFIQTRGLVDEFEATMHGIDAEADPKRRFYRYTKHPINNSRHVAKVVDAFLESKGLMNEAKVALRFVFDLNDPRARDEMLTYGNHSHRHFVMSSLTDDQQFAEIELTARHLAAIPWLRPSRLFSIPFGEEKDFNAATVEAAHRLGYQGMLLSRARYHSADICHHGLHTYERLMPRAASTDSGLLASLNR